MLPGAFSAYNMKALERQSNSDLLKDYFSSIQEKLSGEQPMKKFELNFHDVAMRIFLPESFYYWRFPIHPNS